MKTLLNPYIKGFGIKCYLKTGGGVYEMHWVQRRFEQMKKESRYINRWKVITNWEDDSMKGIFRTLINLDMQLGSMLIREHAKRTGRRVGQYNLITSDFNVIEGIEICNTPKSRDIMVNNNDYKWEPYEGINHSYPLTNKAPVYVGELKPNDLVGETKELVNKLLYFESYMNVNTEVTEYQYVLGEDNRVTGVRAKAREEPRFSGKEPLYTMTEAIDELESCGFTLVREGTQQVLAMRDYLELKEIEKKYNNMKKNLRTFINGVEV